MGKLLVNGAIESTGNVSCVKTGARYLVNNNALELWFGINTDGTAWGIYNNTDGAYIVKQTSSATTFYGNASTATKLATARTISLTGSVTGSGSFDGSGNLSISTTTNHSHSWNSITSKPSTFTPSSHSHNALGDINDNDVASSSATKRYIFMAYNDLTTNRPAYDTRLTFQTSTGTLSAPIFKGDLSGTASYATQADSVYGRYTGSGGNQIPSYIGANTTKFNMMRNFGSSDIGGYMDCILMNNYSWSDVPYATGLGITKNNGYPRAIIANGPKTKWAYTAELLTSYNYSWWALPVSGGTMTGLLTFNLNNVNVTIGQQNSGHFHFILNSGSSFSSFYFNHNVMVNGALGIYNMNSTGCGSSFPSNPGKGQIFFKI